MEEELKHYTDIALIDTGVEEMAPSGARAMEMPSPEESSTRRSRAAWITSARSSAAPKRRENSLRLSWVSRFTQEMFF